MKLIGNLYLVRDTGLPRDYPPRIQHECVMSRLWVAALMEHVAELLSEKCHGDPEQIILTGRALEDRYAAFWARFEDS